MTKPNTTVMAEELQKMWRRNPSFWRDRYGGPQINRTNNFALALDDQLSLLGEDNWNQRIPIRVRCRMTLHLTIFLAKDWPRHEFDPPDYASAGTSSVRALLKYLRQQAVLVVLCGGK